MDVVSPRPTPPPLRALVLVGFVAFIMAAARFMPFIDEPWDGTLVSTCSAGYVARMEHTYQRVGFAALKGQPAFFAMPTQAVEAWPYLHHPPMLYWLTHLIVPHVGFSERAFRLLPIFFSSAAAALLAAMLARRLGTGWGLLGAAFFAVCPMAYFYGWMASFEGAVLFLFELMLILHARLRTRSVRAWSLVAVVFFAATWMDIPAVFGAAMLLVYELLQPRGERRIGRLLLLGPVWIFSVSLLVALDAWWVGGLGNALAQFRGTAEASLIEVSESVGLPQWLRNQGTFWNALYTLPVSLLSALALPVLAVLARRVRDALAIEMLALLVPAVLNVAVFRGHSSTHEFWWVYAIPWAVGSSVLAVRWCWRQRPAAGRVLAVALAAWVLGAGVFQIDARQRDPALKRDYKEFAADLDTFAGPDDALIVSDENMDVPSFYAHCWVYEKLSFVFDRFVGVAKTAPRPLRVKRMVFLVMDSWIASAPPAQLEQLKSLGVLSFISGAELPARAPAIARRHPGVGMFVLIVT